MPKKQCCDQKTHPSHHTELPNLQRIGGQIEGIKKMIDERRYCPDILNQLHAVRAAIRGVEVRILDTHLSACVAEACSSQDHVEQRNKIEEIRKLIKKFE